MSGRLLAAGAQAAAPVELLGDSVAARASREAVLRAATVTRPVLVVAEAGLDAAEIARFIHRVGPRAAAPFVAVDCAALDAEGLEVTLFGAGRTERAGTRAIGLERVSPDSRLNAARGGALVLLNVVELPASLQGRLAGLVRDGEMIVGRTRRVVPFDVRLLATSPPTIDDDVGEGRFRPDLFRRLAAVRIDVPPLRQRPDDVAAIAGQLLRESCRSAGVPPKQLTQAAAALLAAFPWRGNIRELREAMARLVTSVKEDVVHVEHVLAHVGWESPLVASRPNGTLRDARRQFEREYVAAVLERHGWQMSAAARELGLQRPNLYRKVRQLGLVRATPRKDGAA